MKRLFLMFVVVLMMLLASCSTKTERTVKVKSIEYTINYENSTIKDNNYTYRFNFSGNKRRYTVKIIYPDGSFYSVTKSTMKIFASSGDIDSKYADEDVLIDIIVDNLPRSKSTKKTNTELLLMKIGLIIFCTLFGLFLFIFPEVAWFFEVGWKTNGGEPSETYLMINRFIGVIFIIIAIGVLIFLRTKI